MLSLPQTGTFNLIGLCLEDMLEQINTFPNKVAFFFFFFTILIHNFCKHMKTGKKIKINVYIYLTFFFSWLWIGSMIWKTYHVSAGREQPILFTWWAVYCHNTGYEQSHMDSESKDFFFFIIPTSEAWKSSRWLSLRSAEWQRLSRSLHEHLGPALDSLAFSSFSPISISSVPAPFLSSF